MEMWLQGDAYRRENKDKIVADKPTPYPIYSLKLKKYLLDAMNNRKTSSSSRASSQGSNHSESNYTKIVNKVERIKIEDENNGNSPVISQPQSPLNESDEDNGNTVKENGNRPKTMTQGDRLNAIKAKKQAASCGNIPVEKLKGHVRVKSVPTRGVPIQNPASQQTSAAPSRPLTRMMTSDAPKSPKRHPLASPSRKNNAVR